jgi:hypothetical protein
MLTRIDDRSGPETLFDPVDNEMSFERMDSDRRRNLFSLTRHRGIAASKPSIADSSS